MEWFLAISDRRSAIVAPSGNETVDVPDGAWTRHDNILRTTVEPRASSSSHVYMLKP